MEHAQAPGRDRLLGIQMARGMAAFLVCAFHFQNGLSWIVGYVPFWGVFEFGRAGVDFFFVLSGFIIYLVHADDINRPPRLSRYAWRRLGRIYPVYWLATAVLSALTLLSAPSTPALDLDWIVRSLLLLPQPEPPILAIGWSLHHEMVFYTLFAVLIMHRTLGLLLFMLWLVAILYTCLVTPAGVGPMNFISPFDLQFFFGLGAAYVVRHWRIVGAKSLAVLGIAMFALAAKLEIDGAITSTDVAGRLAYGCASALITIGVASAERQGALPLGGLRIRRWVDVWGGMSYALYLFHVIILVVLQAILAALGAGAFLPGWLIVGGSFAIIFGVAAIVHLGFELPMIARVNALSARLARAHPATS